MEFIEIFMKYGPYIGLPVIIYFITNGLKTKVPFFATVTGQRLVHFLPVVLGMVGGLLLPEETWQSKILTGGALGCLNMLVYKFVTVSLAPKEAIIAIGTAKDEAKVKLNEKKD